MLHESTERALALNPEHLRAVAALITMRLPARAADARRAARMRQLVHVTSELNRALSTYACHALVHCQGTAGTSDFDADTQALRDALEHFFREVRDIAREYDDPAMA